MFLSLTGTFARFVFFTIILGAFFFDADGFLIFALI